MAKGPGLYTEIGKKARDLLYKDYQSDHKFTVTTYSPTGVVITSSGTKKGDIFIADVNTQLKNKNITTDIKVDTNSNLCTTITVDEPAPGLKTIFSFKIPDQRSGKLEVQYLHDYAGISTTIGLTANPIINFSGVVGTNVVALGTDVSFDSKTGDFTKCNAGLSFTNSDLIASLTLNDKGDSLNASYYHTLNPLTKTAVGAEVIHSFSSSVNTITIGTQHSLDPLTTVIGLTTPGRQVHSSSMNGGQSHFSPFLEKYTPSLSTRGPSLGWHWLSNRRWGAMTVDGWEQ